MGHCVYVYAETLSLDQFMKGIINKDTWNTDYCLFNSDANTRRIENRRRGVEQKFTEGIQRNIRKNRYSQRLKKYQWVK